MPTRFQNILQNFAAGALSPRMSARVDFEAYNNALKEAKNFIVSTQGGAAYREGMQYLGRPPSNQPFRTFQFRRGGDKSDVMVEVSEGLIRYWVDDEYGVPALFEDTTSLLLDEDSGDFLIDEDDGAFLTIGVALSINPYGLDDLDSLYFSNQADYAVISHTAHPPLYITMERDGTIGAESFRRDKIPDYAYNDANTPRLVSESGDWQIVFDSSWNSHLYYYLVAYHGSYASDASGRATTFRWTDTPATNASNIQGALNNISTNLGYGATFVVASAGDTDGLVYDVTISGDNSGWDIRISAILSYYPSGTNIVTPIVQRGDTTLYDPVAEPAWSYPYYVYHIGTASFYQCTRVHRSGAANEPGTGTAWSEYWDDLGIATPVGFDYMFPSGNDWATDEIYSPFDRGFPTVGEFHNQRLLLMANKDNPTAIYGSALGAYSDFIPGVNDDEAFLFVLDSSDTPQIKWAVSQGNLTLGTSSGEWSLTADVTLTPTDIHAEQQNHIRSYLTRPVQVDVEIFYIEQGQRKLRATRYMEIHRAYTSQDVSVLAEHLVATDGIKRLACGYIPETCLLMLRNNGQPLFLTYEKTQPILAFSEIETDGTVYDMSAYFSLGVNRDYFYFATQRNNEYIIERMRYPDGKTFTDLTENNVVFMDGWVTGTVVGDTISGLEHLEGKAVGVLIDDAWQIGTYTVTVGKVTLEQDFTGADYAVGLVYEGKLETFEMIDNTRVTGFGTKRRWNRLITRLFNSALPIVYAERSADRTPPVHMGIAETVREGLQDVTQNVVGYGDGSIVVLQNRPYPTYIVGFFGEYQVEDR